MNPRYITIIGKMLHKSQQNRDLSPRNIASDKMKMVWHQRTQDCDEHLTKWQQNDGRLSGRHYLI